MGSERDLKALERLYLTLFSASVFGLSTASDCNDFNLTNVNNGGGDWQFYSFSGSVDCFLCYRCSEEQNRQLPDLVLPCMVRTAPSIKKQIQISYLARLGGRLGSNQKSKLLSVEEDEGTSPCQNDSSLTTYLDKDSVMQLKQSLSNFKSGTIQMRGIDPMISYRLKIVLDFSLPQCTICLTNVEFIFSEQQTESNLPIWLLLVIISIVILGSLAAVGVVIRQRKLQVHRQRVKVNVGKGDVQSRQTKDNKTSDEDFIHNTSFGQDLLNNKDKDDHSYCEIDIKQPTKNDLIYNSAYESVSSIR